jgi:polar amino acid transport system substrate-binding protein
VLRIAFRTAATLTLLGGALVLAGCSTTPASSDSASSNPASASTGSGEISTTADASLAELLPASFGDTLTYGLNLTSPPGRFKDAAGNPTGFNVDLGRLIAEKLGLKAEFQDVSFDSIIPGLSAGRFDLTISSMSRTPARLEQIDMVEYMRGGAGVLVKAGNALGVDPADSNSLCGQRVGAMSGSYQEITMVPQFDAKCVAAGLQPLNYTSSANNNDAVLALSSGRLDAVLADSSVTGYAMLQNSGALEAFTFDGSITPTNIGLPKDSALTPVVVKSLQAVMDDGTYQQVLEKWGVGSLSIDTASAESSQGK